MNYGQRKFRSAAGIMATAAALCSTTLFAQSANSSTPLAVNEQLINEIAAQCGAKILISTLPDVEQLMDEKDRFAPLVAAVDLQSSPESCECFRQRVRSVIVMETGRDPHLPPIDAAALQRILQQCRWKNSDGIVAMQGNEIRFEPKASADFKRVDCVLNAIRPYGSKLGFIGNEAEPQ